MSCQKLCNIFMTKYLLHSIVLIFQQPDETDTEMHLMDVSMSTAPEDDPKDYSYHLSQQSTQSSSSATSSSSASDIRSGWNENKWIVNESCLMALFSTCQVPTCGVPIIEKKKSTRGSKIKIEWTCLKNHSGSWMSCPEVRGIPENNLLISAATLFSGTTYTEIAEWASILHLQILKTSQFYCIQRDNLIPVIHFAYKDQQDYLIKRLVREKELGKSIELCGDARCDSPGKPPPQNHVDCDMFRNGQIYGSHYISMWSCKIMLILQTLCYRPYLLLVRHGSIGHEKRVTFQLNTPSHFSLLIKCLVTICRLHSNLMTSNRNITTSNF